MLLLWSSRSKPPVLVVKGSLLVVAVATVGRDWWLFEVERTDAVNAKDARFGADSLVRREDAISKGRSGTDVMMNCELLVSCFEM